MLLIALMLVGFAGLACAIAGVTFLVMRKSAALRDRMIEDVAPEEVRTGKCGICGGVGTNIEMRASSRNAREVLATCWRCAGTGYPPTQST